MHKRQWIEDSRLHDSEITERQKSLNESEALAQDDYRWWKSTGRYAIFNNNNNNNFFIPWELSTGVKK